MRDNGRERPARGGNGRQRLLSIRALSRLFSPIRALFGMPDYISYCRHFRTHHPDRPLPSEREFFDQFVRARYGDGPTRCC